jgi:hypothetical protein
MSTGEIELWPARPLMEEFLKSTDIDSLSTEELTIYNIEKSRKN